MFVMFPGAKSKGQNHASRKTEKQNVHAVGSRWRLRLAQKTDAVIAEEERGWGKIGEVKRGSDSVSGERIRQRVRNWKAQRGEAGSRVSAV